MSVYYQDGAVTLLHGDALEQVAKLPAGSVDCIVTSPPYFGLRDYGVEGQYGLEETPAAYVEALRKLFSECRRVLVDDGTLWLNIGDSYSRSPGKSLLGIPWRTAFALQDDGWILRNSIIWRKPNAMPEPVKDRLAGSHEHIFLFAKTQQYWFDLDPIREEVKTKYEGKTWDDRKHLDANAGGHGRGLSTGKQKDYDGVFAANPRGKNPGDVWSINTQPFAGAHFAAMPQELARRAILSGCKPGGTVLDPFSGSATVGLVAQNNGRKYVGVDISADYLKLSLDTRLQNGVLDFDALV